MSHEAYKSQSSRRPRTYSNGSDGGYNNVHKNSKSRSKRSRRKYVSKTRPQKKKNALTRSYAKLNACILQGKNNSSTQIHNSIYWKRKILSDCVSKKIVHAETFVQKKGYIQVLAQSERSKQGITRYCILVSHNVGSVDSSLVCSSFVSHIWRSLDWMSDDYFVPRIHGKYGEHTDRFVSAWSSRSWE